jgi:hypothetical protein
VLENIDGKVAEVGSSNHEVLNMMKMIETQVGQLAGCLSANEEKLSGQPQGPEMTKAIQTHSGQETEDSEHFPRAREPKPSTEAEEFGKEKITKIITKEPEFEMSGKTLRCRNSSHTTSEVNLIIILRSFVEVGSRLSVNMLLLDAL